MLSAKKEDMIHTGHKSALEIRLEEWNMTSCCLCGYCSIQVVCWPEKSGKNVKKNLQALFRVSLWNAERKERKISLNFLVAAGTVHSCAPSLPAKNQGKKGQELKEERSGKWEGFWASGSRRHRARLLSMRHLLNGGGKKHMKKSATWRIYMARRVDFFHGPRWFTTLCTDHYGAGKISGVFSSSSRFPKYNGVVGVAIFGCTVHVPADLPPLGSTLLDRNVQK